MALLALLIAATAAPAFATGFCCYDGCDNAPASCNDAANWCSAAADNCNHCSGVWCPNAPTPAPTPGPGPTPGPTPAPSPAGILYCPSSGDLTIAYNDASSGDAPQLTNQGWVIHGGGGVATKAAFNLNGGYVEYDIDLTGVHTGVNANIYTISPTFASSSGYVGTDYCDGAKTDSDWCLEVDWIESNGNCGGATTLHTIKGPGYPGCTAWGCRNTYHYSTASFHMRIEYGADGTWTTIRDGVTIAPSSLSPPPSSSDWAIIKAAHETKGAVLYSSLWTGWVPVDDCGTAAGDLNDSTFKISNLRINGQVVQGPTPTKCGLLDGVSSQFTNPVLPGLRGFQDHAWSHDAMIMKNAHAAKVIVEDQSFCDEQCKDTCCRNGGGVACVTACGCSGSCPSGTVEATMSARDQSFCDEQCKDTCCRNGGGEACVTACGCSGSCPSGTVEQIMGGPGTATATPSGKYHAAVPFILDMSIGISGSSMDFDMNVKVAHQEIKCPTEDIAISSTQITFPNIVKDGDCMGDALRGQKKDVTKFVIDVNSDGTLTFHSDGWPNLKLKPVSAMSAAIALY